MADGDYHYGDDDYHDDDNFHDDDDNQQGLAYLGEYPLAWSACLCNETIYNLLVEEGADPNHQVIIHNHQYHHHEYSPSASSSP